MTLESQFGGPKLKGGHADDVFEGDPLAIIAIFVEAIRERFREPGLPWIWRPEPLRPESEENTPGNPSGIVIESAYLEDPDARNWHPAIFVDVENTVPQQVVSGNRVVYDPGTGLEVFLIHAVVPVTITCVGTKRGESGSLGSHVWFHLLAVSRLLRETFRFQAISLPIRSKTMVYQRSANTVESWQTAIGLDVTVKFLWATKPIAPQVRQIALRITQSGVLGNPVVTDATLTGPAPR
jgi:hypothetical protein